MFFIENWVAHIHYRSEVKSNKRPSIGVIDPAPVPTKSHGFSLRHFNILLVHAPMYGLANWNHSLYVYRVKKGNLVSCDRPAAKGGR